MKSLFVFLAACTAVAPCLAKVPGPKDPKFVSLREAHDGRTVIDLKILNQFEDQPKEVQAFYTEARAAILAEDADQLAKVCQKYGHAIIGSPMLGTISDSGVSIKVHSPVPTGLKVVLSASGSQQEFVQDDKKRINTVACSGLKADTAYSYEIFNDQGVSLGSGKFTTAPAAGSAASYKIAIGADFHKIGLHRPELLDMVRQRGNRAMVLLGDLAVDGRKTIPTRNIDYLLRDVSPVWQRLAANVPTYTSWDDHDYFGNDTSGDYHAKSSTPIPVKAMRKNWKRMWNNPESDIPREGIYFQTVIGDTQLIMLDTRSCRSHEKQGQLYSFLGKDQTDWLKKTLKESQSPVILISSGTMWSDYISQGKDSWGTWDREGREEIYQLIDGLEDKKVLLFSGDRHGAHAFRIKRPNGKDLIEFGVGALGGVPGGGVAKDRSTQLFAYRGVGFWALGELEFRVENGQHKVTFRLIDPEGKILEKVEI
ncbi:alkaline phosphatase D family protein [Verrucomicrobiaceae bacterium 5K15]|uniref:Alkaline phosphatase D family protein n=1 Tax=Oceaniferula flava TaxID=2800421 RepID=A0AAE2V8D9_9BACT|nr:alkaline phosphatase D family protein [Oceaniferula flavus]MBK1855417.1 alkaline phosphatase D family protein [Oceaniferula flavus]MBM1136723.1 alkaline phosphatase D family protein [Oceaniferula flavus]